MANVTRVNAVGRCTPSSPLSAASSTLELANECTPLRRGGSERHSKYEWQQENRVRAFIAATIRFPNTQFTILVIPRHRHSSILWTVDVDLCLSLPAIVHCAFLMCVLRVRGYFYVFEAFIPADSHMMQKSTMLCGRYSLYVMWKCSLIDMQQFNTMFEHFFSFLLCPFVARCTSHSVFILILSLCFCFVARNTNGSAIVMKSEHKKKRSDKKKLYWKMQLHPIV